MSMGQCEVSGVDLCIIIVYGSGSQLLLRLIDTIEQTAAHAAAIFENIPLAS